MPIHVGTVQHHCCTLQARHEYAFGKMISFILCIHAYLRVCFVSLSFWMNRFLLNEWMIDAGGVRSSPSPWRSPGICIPAPPVASACRVRSVPAQFCCGKVYEYVLCCYWLASYSALFACICMFLNPVLIQSRSSFSHLDRISFPFDSACSLWFLLITGQFREPICFDSPPRHSALVRPVVHVPRGVWCHAHWREKHPKAQLAIEIYEWNWGVFVGHLTYWQLDLKATLTRCPARCYVLAVCPFRSSRLYRRTGG